MIKCVLVQIGELKKGLNPPSVEDMVFVSPYLGTAVKAGLVTGIIALAVINLLPNLISHRCQQ